MAVYEHTYRRYTGPLSPRWQRFLVPARYAVSEVFASRFFVAVFALAFVVPLGMAVLLYLRANLTALESLGVQFVQQIPIDARFFFYFLRAQSFAGLFLTLMAGPGLVAPDLAHNALPLYLSRPFSRWEYVLGKGTVLAALLSLVTWVPGLLLLLLQTQLAGFTWLSEHLRLVPAVFLGSWVWILMLTLLALALSALVRWRTVAAGLFFAVFVVTKALGTFLVLYFETRWGQLVDLRQQVEVIWQSLFYGQVDPGDIPAWAGWVGFLVVVGLSLLALQRKLRAYEVVR